MEWFSRALNIAVDDGYINPYKTKRCSVRVNHLLYADDMLIFSNGSKDSIRNLLSLVDDFCTCSGQRLNAAKSMIIFSKDIPPRRRNEIKEITGFADSTLPMSYLGVPLFRGHMKLEYYIGLVERIQDRIQGWFKNFLSMGGRVTLVNSVLNSMSIHNMLVMPIPVKTLARIVSLLSAFIWDNGEARRRHWVGWRRLILAKEFGGLGLKNPSDINLALKGRLAWRFLQQNSLWARYAMSRFKEDRSGSIVWNGFRHLINTIREECSWRIGRGDSTMNEICDRLNWQCPEVCKGLTVREVVMQPDLWHEAVDGWPRDAQSVLRNVTFSESADMIVWTKANDGCFTTKLFWESFQSRGVPRAWASRIWTAYLPPKIGCFIWRCMLNAIPTDENVQRLGINLSSKCVCCNHAKSENLEHFLINSDWAKRFWRVMEDLFDKPAPSSMVVMSSLWFEVANDSFISHIGSILAAAGLWEMWKARNSFLYENRRVDWLRIALGWPAKLAHLIKKVYHPSFRHEQLLQALRITAP